MNIRHIREALGDARGAPVTQRELAEFAGVDPSTVYRWETGEKSPSVRNLKRLRDGIVSAGYEWRDVWVWLD